MLQSIKNSRAGKIVKYFVICVVGLAVIAIIAAPDERASAEARVLSITEGSKIPSIKRSVVVRLSKEISQTELETLGRRIRDQDSGYQSVFIEYYLPGMPENAGAWAVTHWRPNLTIKIFGNVQRFDNMTKAEADEALITEYLKDPAVAALLRDPEFVAREEAGWAAVSCDGVKGTDALHAPFRAAKGSHGEAWSTASAVMAKRFEKAEREGKPFDCSVVGKYLAKDWLIKVN